MHIHTYMHLYSFVVPRDVESCPVPTASDCQSDCTVELPQTTAPRLSSRSSSFVSSIATSEMVMTAVPRRSIPPTNRVLASAPRARSSLYPTLVYLLEDAPVPTLAALSTLSTSSVDSHVAKRSRRSNSGIGICDMLATVRESVPRGSAMDLDISIAMEDCGHAGTEGFARAVTGLHRAGEPLMEEGMLRNGSILLHGITARARVEIMDGGISGLSVAAGIDLFNLADVNSSGDLDTQELHAAVEAVRKAATNIVTKREVRSPPQSSSQNARRSHDTSVALCATRTHTHIHTKNRDN